MSQEFQAKIIAALFASAAIALLVMIAWDLGRGGSIASTADLGAIIR